jgi:hypothetical protein
MFLDTSLTQSPDTFPDFIANGTVSADWKYVRMTDNHYSKYAHAC